MKIKELSDGIKGSLSVLMACVSLVVVFSTRHAFANDIQITNQTVHPHSGGTGEVEFDLSWSNSWRSRYPVETYNWDAAWVFCKIRRNGGDWTHLYLDQTGHTIPQSPVAITTALGRVDPTIAHNASTNPNVGIFLYRTNDGFGTFTANDMRLRWNYSDNGASSGDVIEIRVLGVEMVYIPEGTFYAGDGPNSTTTSAFRDTSDTTSGPWSISSENAITTSTTSPYYFPSVITIPAEFPKGYAPFYMAKGELSQAMYMAFFNTLTKTQKDRRDITGNVTSPVNYGGKNTDAITNHNNLSWSGSGEMTLNGGTHGGVAMNYLAWGDLTAFLDWSGLRPMSELEFEKAGRGSRGVSSPIAAVGGEYAWGSTSITQATSISNSGLGSERGQSGSNCAYNNAVQGPLRVGSFAKGVDTRVTSGGGFYGVMELCGNVWERAVTVGNSTGLLFEGRYHGNGVLDSDGEANVTTWPGTNAVGAGLRGGDWNTVASGAWLSGRDYAASAGTNRRGIIGGRGVRSAP